MARSALPLLNQIVGFWRTRKPRIRIALFALCLLFPLCIASAPTQAQSSGWAGPYRLSSDAGRASEAALVTDPFGFVHAFWTETLYSDGRQIIQYARFDGTTWSTPNAIYVTGQGIGRLSAVVDKQGTLYVAWTERLNGPAYYTYASAHDALSARSWAKPVLIDIPAGIIRFLVDSKGVFHVVYINRGEDLGVYYIRSADQGQTWSEPIWLDPDIRPNHSPDSLNFDLDENDGLHTVWFYGALGSGARADWVRYAHSLDGGNTWSSPFTIDQANATDDYNLTNASPRMIVQGKVVHIIWAAGTLPYRHYRSSKDAGKSWSPPTRIFGELHGQAFDGLTVDGAGRVHFVGQIRYPMAIYHSVWDQTQWTAPSLVYLLAPEDSDIEETGRIHAHDVTPVIRDGNQLVITFGDGPADPNRRLFVMYRTLDDVAPLPLVPTPKPTDAWVPPPSPTPPTPLPTATANALLSDTGTQPPGYIPAPDFGLQMGLIPILFLLGSTIVIQLWNKRTH